MPIESYLRLDLTHGGDAARDLSARIDREGAARAISLTGDGDAGAMSPNLTPAMSAWLGAHIARIRGDALNTVEGAAKRIKLPGGVEGVVEEVEHDRLRQRRNARKSQESSAFYERHRGTLDDRDDAEREYQALRAHHGGREAQVPSKFVVYGVPLFIMVPEFAMNFSSFVKIAGVPAIAAGLSLVVALAVAIASYMTGVFWKAYQFYMHPDDQGQRSKGLRLISIAASLLIISLVAVGYARYQTVAEQVQAALILGLTPPNAFAQTAGLLAGNLIVFAIGAAVTYLAHDEDPEYAKKAEIFQRLRTRCEAARRGQLVPKLDGIDAGFREDEKRLKRKAAQMLTQSDYADIAHDAGRIASKDTEVIGLLRDYRSRLADRLSTHDPDFRFTGATVDRYAGNTAETISLNDFCARPLHLYRSS